MLAYDAQLINNPAVKHEQFKTDTRSTTVELRTTCGLITQTVDHGLLAVDDAVIDMARERAGVAADRFQSGEVVR